MRPGRPRGRLRSATPCVWVALRCVLQLVGDVERLRELRQHVDRGRQRRRSPFTSVLSKRTVKSHQRISNVALPLTRSGRGPSSDPVSLTLNRLCEPRFSCSRAWKSAMKCSGMSCTSTSKPTSPSTLKPAALAYSSARAPNCTVLEVIAK